jgi:protein-disulfide isomerase
MMLSRRTVVAALAASPLLGAAPALAQDIVSTSELNQPGPLPEKALGNADAKVTIVEYASMTCSHCARFHKETFPALKEKYIDTGKVRFILREFPLDPRATAGFMLARCAGDDKYFAMVDVLFHQQPSWAFVEGPKVLDAMSQIAKQAGFTQQQFEACLKDQALYDGINTIKARAEEKFGVNSTPTFFVNGKRASGEMTIEEFDKLIAPLLGNG